MNIRIKHVLFTGLMLSSFNTILPLMQEEQDVCEVLYRHNRRGDDFSQVDLIKNNVDVCIEVMNLKIEETEFKFQVIKKKLTIACMASCGLFIGSVTSTVGIEILRDLGLRGFSYGAIVSVRNAFNLIVATYCGAHFYEVYRENRDLFESLAQDKKILALLEEVKAGL